MMQRGDRMSNQEAIALLRNLEDSLDSYCELNEEGKTAFRMAIEALSCSEFPNSSDTIYRQAAINAAIDAADDWDGGYSLSRADMIERAINNLPSARPERTCVNCGRTVNNGGWYADGRTRCPIEEHYALPKDGYCHLWEKRNVTDDDYPERRTDGEIIPE